MLEKYKNVYANETVNQIRNLILSSSKDLEFIEESHQYFLDGIELQPVSNITHKFQKPTDFDMICRVKAEKEGIPYEELKASWDYNKNRACCLGSSIHAYLESAYYYALNEYDKILPSDRLKFTGGVLYPTCPREEAGLDFWNDLPACMIPVLSEARVINKEKGYAGTFDLLLYYDCELDPNRNEYSVPGLVIVDYKSNADLMKNFSGQRLLAPFENMLDQPFSLYTLQLSAYEIPLRMLGLPVIGRRIIWIKPDGTYEKFNVPSVAQELWNAL